MLDNLRRPVWLSLVLVLAAGGLFLILKPAPPRPHYLLRTVPPGPRYLSERSLAVAEPSAAEADSPSSPEAGIDKDPPGLPLSAALSYTNYQVSRVPWSIHVVRVERSDDSYELHSVHARGAALGLGPLTAQIVLAGRLLGTPVAAINGDFYQRGGGFVGDPRGIQIVDGEVISAPNGGAGFWIDAQGQPHLTNILSRLAIVWPNGTKTPCGLNEERRGNRVELYTPTLGRSTGTSGGLELVLEKEGSGPWLPLRMGETYTARVRSLRTSGNARVEAETLVASFGAAVARGLPQVVPGMVLQISTESEPSLRGAKTAIGGGPILVHHGRRQPIHPGSLDRYEERSMLQRHPRAAIGWNQKAYLLVAVDGRQWNVSVGMTLDELAELMVRLGCEEALNFDGGGSAELWYEGQIVNNPCDGRERDIANSIVIVKKTAEMGKSSDHAQLNP